MPCASLEAAKKDFEKKFREKTKNSWAARENFIAQPGKYTLIEVQPGAGQEVEVALRVSTLGTQVVTMVGWLPSHSWPAEHQDIHEGQQDGMGFLRSVWVLFATPCRHKLMGKNGANGLKWSGRES